MDLPPGAGRRTTYSLLPHFPDDAAAPATANVLQRQSSGSSYGAGSSISASSDYPFHLQPPASAAGVAPPGAAARPATQQDEETYHLQLVLSVRLYADAVCAANPSFLVPGDSGSGNGRTFPLTRPAPSANELLEVQGLVGLFRQHDLVRVSNVEAFGQHTMATHGHPPQEKECSILLAFQWMFSSV